MNSFKEFLEAYGDSAYGPIPSMTPGTWPNWQYNTSEFQARGIKSNYMVQDGPSDPEKQKLPNASKMYGNIEKDKKPKVPKVRLKDLFQKYVNHNSPAASTGSHVNA